MDPTNHPGAPLEPKLYTYTCRLPFVLGFTDSLTHRIDLPGHFTDPKDKEMFGSGYVNVRMYNARIADYKFWPVNMSVAVQHFYEGDIGPPNTEHPLHEQWLSLETPGAIMQHENPDDPAYTFHRCLHALNIFLRALALARQDDRLRAVSSRELRPIVIIGALTPDNKWHYLGPMLMHPDAKELPPYDRSAKAHIERLKAALQALYDDEPFIPSQQWRARAERSRYEGNAADAVISFQIAAETLLYTTWRMLMVDEGLTSTEIADRAARELPFKSLLTRELHSKLGGNWDVTRASSPIGTYWGNLYEKRNRILHSGYQAHDGDAEQAEEAFLQLEKFVEEQLQRNCKKYPRTLLVKIGQAGIEQRGWMTRWMADFIEKAGSEPGRFFIPKDTAGR